MLFPINVQHEKSKKKIQKVDKLIPFPSFFLYFCIILLCTLIIEKLISFNRTMMKKKENLLCRLLDISHSHSRKDLYNIWST